MTATSEAEKICGCPHPLVAGCDHDAITTAALEAEKSLPPEVVPRSGPLEIHAVALLDQDGFVVATMPIAPVRPNGGDITFTFNGLGVV